MVARGKFIAMTQTRKFEIPEFNYPGKATWEKPCLEQLPPGRRAKVSAAIQLYLEWVVAHSDLFDNPIVANDQSAFTPQA
jgi:hypothetical protein